MKTSIKIFLSSIALLGAAVVIYDLQLDAAYRKGDYTKPFYNYVKMNFTGFDRIDMNSSTAFNILLVPGEYKVLVSPNVLDYLDIHQEGTTLVVNAHFLDHFRDAFGDYSLYVSCPTLKTFKADARYSVGKTLMTDSTVRFVWYQPMVISGFNLDSLDIAAQNGTKLALKNDTIRKLTANLARGADLTLDKGNQFSGGDMKIMNGARLSVETRGMQRLNYHLADSAELNINGAAAKQLLKINQP
ncbi:MAG TPA: hypothetical protein VNV35_10635 [Puia sp.]|nr:hypothetical protein [Puia sp.]